MISLQRVRGLWRIYLDNQEDRELLLSSTLVLRNKSVNFYTRNPRYAFKEKTDTTKVRVKDIPLSADDGQIIKALEDHNWDIVKFFRERLRIDNYLTNCQTGDWIIICNPIDTSLPRSLVMGKYRATILHYGQPKPWAEKLKCSKCLGNGHKANECVVDWRCRICGVLGHKQSECKKESFSDHGNDSSSESDMENDNKDENHVDDHENDMTNNSKEEEEKTVQNPPIENHDNSRNTEAMEGKLEQSQSILGEQREGDKPTATMKKQQQMTQYINEKLAGNINSEDSSKSTPIKKERAFRIVRKISNHSSWCPSWQRKRERSEKGKKKTSR